MLRNDKEQEVIFTGDGDATKKIKSGCSSFQENQQQEKSELMFV